MPRITFRFSSGEDKVIDAPVGKSLMEVARHADISGIIAECGGSLSCATCHVYVDDNWLARVPPPGAAEIDMLDAVPEFRPGSRLSCQIFVSDALDGLLVQIPESQI
jgi:ferredoxin, 2Fe-2S